MSRLVVEELRKFLLDKPSGRILLHVKDGEILTVELTRTLNRGALKED